MAIINAINKQRMGTPVLVVSAMPAAICAKLKSLTGLDYVEGYGMSETMAATHINPPQRPKRQCLGIPIFGVDSRIVDPLTLRELPQGEAGEIVVVPAGLYAKYAAAGR